MTTYYVLRIGSVVTRLAPLALLYALAGLAARLAALFPTGARAAVRANISRVMNLPPTHPAVVKATTTVLRCQALNYIDLMRVSHVSPAEFDASVVAGDTSPLTDCLARGKGAIIVSGHLGNVDYTVQWLALHGFTLHTLMERLEPPKLYDLVRTSRKGAGVFFYPADQTAVPVLTKVLRDGGLTALLVDRDISGTGESTTFFGAPARLPVGPVLLALRTGAPLVPAFGRRLRDNRLYVTVKEPVYLERTRDLRADLRTGLDVMARILEEGISAAPDQWVVFEDLWALASDGAATEDAA